MIEPVAIVPLVLASVLLEKRSQEHATLSIYILINCEQILLN
jgi:hypothetical protein